MYCRKNNAVWVLLNPLLATVVGFREVNAHGAGADAEDEDSGGRVVAERQQRLFALCLQNIHKVI